MNVLYFILAPYHTLSRAATPLPKQTNELSEIKKKKNRQ